MQVSVVKPESGLEHKINVTIPSGDLDSKIEQRLNEMRRTMKMDGFRPGKVPMTVVKKRYGGQIRQEMMGEKLQQSFYDAVTQESLNVAGYPTFDSLDEKDGNIEFTATFEVFPEVVLPDLASVNVEKVSAEVTEEDVNGMMTKLREQKSAWKPANGNKKAKMGEQVILDFVGKKDGVEFEGGKAENVPLVLGSGQMIPGFEDGLVGMKKGEEKVLELTFPEDYQAEELKGQPVTFDVTVHSVQTRELAEVDEAFVKSFGVEAGTEEALVDEIRSNMERELERAVDNQNRTASMDALADAVELEVPQAVVKEEAQGIMNRQMEAIQQQGMDPKGMNLSGELFMPEANKRVKLGLLVNQVIKENEIKVTDEARKEYIEGQASSYEDPKEVIEWYAQNPQAQKDVDAVLIERQVAETILSKATVTEVTKSFDEIVNTSM